MKRYQSSYAPAEAIYVQPISMGTLFANLVNITLWANRVPALVSVAVGGKADEPALSLHQITEYMSRARATVSAWRGDAVDLSTADALFDARKRFDSLEKDIKSLILQLGGPRVEVRDYGRCVAHALAGHSAWWAMQHAVAPSTAGARPFLTDTSPPATLGDMSWLQLPNPMSPLSRYWAVTWAAVDMPVWSADLLPKANPDVARNLPLGAVKDVQNQATALQRPAFLYLWQLPRFVLEVHYPLIRTACDLKMRADPHAKAAVEGWLAKVEFVRERIPLHSCLYWAATILLDLRLNALPGEKILHPRFTNRRTSGMGALEGTPADACLTADSELRRELIDEVMRDAVSPPIEWTNSGPVVDCHLYGWGIGGLRAGTETENKPITIGDAARVIASTPELAENLQAVANVLHWSKPTGKGGMLDALASDWIMTDGEYFSDHPGRALLGLTPLLSLGNIRRSGLAVRHDDDFNVGTGRQLLSIAPVRGRSGLTGDPARFERTHMPLGASMGEQGIHYEVTTGYERFEYSTLVVEYFRKRATQYSRFMYGELLILPPDTAAKGFVLHQPSWDAYGFGPIQSALEAAWSTALEVNNEGVSSSDTLLYTLGDRPIPHRIPILMARGVTFEVYDHLGAYVGAGKYEGHVEFGGKEDVHLPFGPEHAETAAMTVQLDPGLAASEIVDNRGAKG